ncbi:hypothetical protein SAMN05880582_11254 [Rhizobium sp. RU20A]|uniref:hypothetical protein n=1 Tax=Rhizobium sp. RU20A TaxID=1907412 RepID=UPI000954ED8F|nr:hypothetical protein [Rhizobium sp. RU20A]SIR40446.1 hypothetical protein SAMN05880582_11254 [Rhizobium sp. RU20A]
MISAIPLMLVPFALYNLAMIGLFGAAPGIFDAEMLAFTMVSGARWGLTFGDLLIVAALALLFVEILKATRISSKAIVDHMLSLVVFLAFLVEFLLVAPAASRVFFILMTISFIDVIAGFAVSMRTASRDVSIGL